MNILNKLTATVLLGVLAQATTVSAHAAEVFGITLPDLSVATTHVGKVIAAEVTTQLRNALRAPRPARVRQSPSVFITEGTAMVVVEATRLPAIEEIDMKVTRTTQVRL